MPEKMLPAGSIDNLYAEFSEPEPNGAYDSIVSSNGFNIYMDASLDTAEHGLARWRWYGTYDVFTYPQLHRTVDSTLKPIGTPPVTIANPRGCSGWVLDKKDKTHQKIIQVDTCRCCKCWVTENNLIPLISDEKFTKGDKVTKFNIAFIQATRRHFFERYYLEVVQMSTSKTVYEFWENVGKQKQSGSDLFQTPPARTVGNVVAKTNGQPNPVGVFAVAAVKRRSLVLSRKDVPYTLMPIDTIRDYCYAPFEQATIRPPSFW